MTYIEGTPSPTISDLLAEVDAKKLAVPEFQRDFVWRPGATISLLNSLIARYPAGSLLLLGNSKNDFLPRPVTGAPQFAASHKPAQLVLDGQQRLTAIYQVFSGVGDHRYFLDVGKLLAGHSFEDCLLALKATDKRAKALLELKTQANDLVLPLSELKPPK